MWIYLFTCLNVNHPCTHRKTALLGLKSYSADITTNKQTNNNNNNCIMYFLYNTKVIYLFFL